MPGRGDRAPFVGDETGGVAQTAEVRADRGGRDDRPLHRRVRALAGVTDGPSVEQEGCSALPGLLFAANHELIVPGRGAPVHPSHVIALLVYPHGRVFLAGCGDCARPALATAVPLAV